MTSEIEYKLRTAVRQVLSSGWWNIASLASTISSVVKFEVSDAEILEVLHRLSAEGVVQFNPDSKVSLRDMNIDSVVARIEEIANKLRKLNLSASDSCIVVTQKEYKMICLYHINDRGRLKCIVPEPAITDMVYYYQGYKIIME